MFYCNYKFFNRNKIATNLLILYLKTKWSWAVVVVSMLAFYADDPSSNLAEAANRFFCKISV